MLEAYILLDRSGSMTSNWAETIGSINGYVEGLNKGGNEAIVNVIAFDDSEPFYILRDAVSLETWTDIKDDEISPRGFTPLYDSLGKTLQKASEGDNEKVVVVVVTDGMENSSREFTATTIKKAVDDAKAKGWEIIFLSADLTFNARHYTDTLGLDSSKFINTSNATRGATMGSLAEKTLNYSRSLGDAAGAAMSFTCEEQAIAEEKIPETTKKDT
jgi:Mg-chelatase subunit ChlD